jgi:hypothetical protein
MKNSQHKSQEAKAKQTISQTLQGAQLVLGKQDIWHIFGPVRGNIDRITAPALPAVTCPVVDLSTLDEELVEQVSSVIAARLTPSGSLDMEGIVAELYKLGAPMEGLPVEGF